MKGLAAAATAAIILIVILVIGAYVWHTYFGWTPFTYATKESPQWTPENNKSIEYLRFKNCMYTITLSNGQSASYDVAPALNSMAVAYAGGTSNPATLVLTAPLNAFSFVIPAFNDSKSVSDPTTATWTSAAVTLVGNVRTL